MRYGSVCSGIEAATVAWKPLGWRAVWFAEIEPFCCALLTHHYPEIPNYGDFTQIGLDTHRADLGERTRNSRGRGTHTGRGVRSGDCDGRGNGNSKDAAPPIDVLVGGTPCQDFSVAGLRKGMDGARGQLTIEFLALAGRLRPRWVVWENVPGVLSIDGGRAFGMFLGGLGHLGYRFAYRVLDAQHFGVPQRRRRVFVIGHLGDWRRAAAVLFERTSLSGHPAPGRETGEDVARCVATGTNSQRYDWETETFAISGRAEYKDGLGTLRAQGGDLGGGSEMLVANPLPGHHPRADLDNDTYVTHTLTSDGFDASEGGSGRRTPLVALPLGSRVDRGGSHREAEGNNLIPATSPSIRASYAKNAFNANSDYEPAVVKSAMGVRRLTPRECERLMGMPDDYTLIPYRGKPAADGPRYRALGNSMAVPVMRWIGERIAMVEKL